MFKTTPLTIDESLGQVNITSLTKISTCQSSLIGWRVHQTAQIAESPGQVNTTLLTKVAHIAI